MPTPTQKRQNALGLEDLPQAVTIVDPAHPFFGQTLPLVRQTTPGGRRRFVPLSATDYKPASEPSHQLPDRYNLPRVSVRTILPVARLMKAKLCASKENADDPPTETARGAICPSGEVDPPPQPMTLWHQLNSPQQRQLAQLLAHLIQRCRQTSPTQEESDREQR